MSVKKASILSFIMGGCLGVLNAQVYDVDALKFSYQHTAGTARCMGVSGAFGSVGADLSSTLGNPAGIALYRSIDISLGIGLHIVPTSSNYFGQERRDNNTRFTFNSAGLVYAGAIKNKSSNISFSAPKLLKFVNFAVTYNKINNLNRSVTYEGLNRNNTYAESWTNELNNLNGAIPDFSNTSVAAMLGYQNETIRYDSLSGQYVTYIKPTVAQRGTIRERGSTDEVNLALGFNINEKVFFAVDAGIPFLTYSAVNEFIETDNADSITDFENYRFVQEYRTNGVGFNLKLGIIYRPTDWYRVGIAYHTPTWYRLDENYYAYVIERWRGNDYSQQADAAPFRYNVHTPMRGIFSNSFYFKQHGFFSVDYEFVNYGAIKHKFSGYEEDAVIVNRISKTKYGYGHTVRAGIEGAIKWFRIRGGYTWQSSAFKKNVGVKGNDEQRHIWSLGAGYRGKRFYTDLAFQQMRTANYYQQYASNDGNEPGVRTSNVYNNVMLTIGWRFTTKQ